MGDLLTWEYTAGAPNFRSGFSGDMGEIRVIYPSKFRSLRELTDE
jgi:hypothetical protein